MAELGIFQVKTVLTMVKHSLSCVKVTYHHALILSYTLNKPLIHLMILPHLHYVNNLSDVIPRAFNHLFNYLSLNL